MNVRPRINITILDSTLARLVATEPYLVASCVDPAAFSFQEIEKPSLLALKATTVNPDNNETGGLKWLQDARLEGFDRPAIVFSFEEISQFQQEFPIVESKGVVFARLPIVRERLLELIDDLNWLRLSETELAEICRWKSGLIGTWRKTAHHIGNLMNRFPESLADVRLAVADWTSSIERFAPDQLENLERLRTFVFAEPGTAKQKDISTALQSLDTGLQIPPEEGNSEAFGMAMEIPPLPPKGFSKVLIADDIAQIFVAEMLRSEYRYEVIPQAAKLRDAIDRIEEHNPGVVLADLCFKRTNREYEVPRREVGEELIKFATKDKNRLVLVTSKSALRTDELLRGTVNCSGSHRATDAASIHRTIWNAAAARGVTEPETFDGIVWGPELRCRQRLDAVLQILPDLIEQWTLFPGLIRQTLNLTRLLPDASEDPDSALVLELRQILIESTSENDISPRVARELFRKGEEIHVRAKEVPETVVKLHLRNLLHGKIEQSSSVLSAADGLRRVLGEVGTELASLHRRQESGTQLLSVLATYSEDHYFLPFLKRLVTAIENADRQLPLLPQAPGRPNQRVGAVATEIRIVIVEDSSYWASRVVRICNRLQEAYAGIYDIVVDTFQSAAEALATLAPRDKAFAITPGIPRKQTIAILDICIPKDADQIERIALAERGEAIEFATPDSANGLELIRELSDFDRNVPIIVFSTKDNVPDRKKVCGWGIPECNFISKEPGAERFLTRALQRLIEKSDKFVLTRVPAKCADNNGTERPETVESDEAMSPDTYIFNLNGLVIPLSDALFSTFTAMYELCQRNQRAFTLDEIIEYQEMHSTEESRRLLQDHVHRIRQKIFETAHANRIYVDVHDLIRTLSRARGEEYGYELNAEILSPDEEVENYDARDQDVRSLGSRNKILLIGKSSDTIADIAEVLENKGYDLLSVPPIGDIEAISLEFEPNIIVIAADDVLEPVGLWTSLKGAMFDQDLAALFVFRSNPEAGLANKMSQSGVPLDCLISSNSPNWLSEFLHALENERTRVFVGDVADLSSDIPFPIVEIIDTTNFETGLLELRVNGRPFRMKPRKESALAPLLGHLLANPGRMISWSAIATQVGGGMMPTDDDRRNWPKRLRDKIENEWLDLTIEDRAEKARLILENSADGLRLNVRTVDLRQIVSRI
jgi:DNA-binding response OmpR family regulator